MIAQFALRLICGMSLMWALMPRRQVTSGFFRIQMLVVMGLGVLAALSFSMDAQSTIREAGSSGLASALPSPMGAAMPSALIAAMGFVGSVLWTLERRKFGGGVGIAILLLSLGQMILPFVTAGSDITVVYWHDTMIFTNARPMVAAVCPVFLATLSEITNAGLLGSVVVGMLLGHWYLTTPTMSIEPLKRINLFVGVSAVLRFIVSILIAQQMATCGIALAEGNVLPAEWLALRWIAGILGPIFVSLMVWRILKYRNTQAATGVLFVGVILVLIGDMTAALLLRKTGWPL